jgi:hypothetical protein
VKIDGGIAPAATDTSGCRGIAVVLSRGVAASERAKRVPGARLWGEDAEDTRLLKGMLREARTFVTSFRWCRCLKKISFGLGVGGIVAVFLAKIEPAEADVDDELWVVVGDVPPAYLVTEESPDPKAALRAYIAEMRRWIRAVRAGRSTRELIPVNAPATREMAKRLEIRLDFLEQKVLPSKPRRR